MESVLKRFSNFKERILIKSCLLFNRWKEINNKETMCNIERAMKAPIMETQWYHMVVPTTEEIIRGIEAIRVMVEADMGVLPGPLSTNNIF